MQLLPYSNCALHSIAAVVGTVFVVWWEDAYLQDFHEGMTVILLIRFETANIFL